MYGVIHQKILDSRQQNKKLTAVLIDPDKAEDTHLDHLLQCTHHAGVDMLLLGGSLLSENRVDKVAKSIKQRTALPVILFPGHALQLTAAADAILFHSLISGRNPEYLIGQHVQAAPMIRHMNIETISAGYILVDGGQISTTSYITQTIPVPAHKSEIAVATALAGEMLGMKMIYLEAGSGARRTVPEELIRDVVENISIPVWTGGGIDQPEKAYRVAKAGSDVVVFGNIFEKDTTFMKDMIQAVHAASGDLFPHKSLSEYV
jgi:phosphoglycerol geranylgeranyltransferase